MGTNGEMKIVASNSVSRQFGGSEVPIAPSILSGQCPLSIATGFPLLTPTFPT